MTDRMILTPYFLDKHDPRLEVLADDSWRIVKPELPDGTTQLRIACIHERLADAVQQAVNDGERPVSVAGDCCTTLGVMAGLQCKEVTPLFLWLDAHGDLNTWETTPSGFLGGMPLAMMMGLGEQTIVNALKLKPIATNSVILSDGRDLDSGETDLIARENLTWIRDFTQLKQQVPGDRPVYLHFDTDILDPEDAPAMGYLAPGGPSISDMHDVFRYLSANTDIVAVSMSTWRPSMDQNGRSRNVCMDLLASILGK